MVHAQDILRGVVGIGVLLGPARAQALMVRRNVCVKYTVDFDDADTGVGDDVLTSTDPVAARGVKIRVVDSTGTTVVSWYSDVDGATVGFLPDVSVELGAQYTIFAYSSASIHGNLVVVHNDDSTDQEFVEGWSWTVGSHSGLDPGLGQSVENQHGIEVRIAPEARAPIRRGEGGR